MDFVRVGEDWKMPAPVRLAKGGDGHLKLMRAVSKVKEQITKEMEAGKYLTADEAASAIDDATPVAADRDNPLGQIGSSLPAHATSRVSRIESRRARN
jgi:hypothetical protein